MLIAFLGAILNLCAIDGESRLDCADSMRVHIEFDSVACDTVLLVATLNATPACQKIVSEYGSFVRLSFSAVYSDTAKAKIAEFGDMGVSTEREISKAVCYKRVPRKSSRASLTYMAKLKISEEAKGILIEKSKFSSGVFEFLIPAKDECVK